jgi:glycosyltransferase involved in cell wall biosynthesis
MAVKYSVIIPTLNEEKFLPNLLESLAHQTDKNFEVIVVDGSSKDKTVAIAKSFASKLPKLHVISTKACLPMQRNTGAAAAKGEWLVFVDADSILMPYFFERVTKFIAQEKPSVFTTWFQSDSSVNKDAIFTLLSNAFIESMLFIKRPFPQGPLACFRRDIFTKIGGYDETHKYHEDIDLGLRLKKNGIPFSILRETLFVWSLRRFRREGTSKVMQQYILSILPVIFFSRSVKSMPGYVMGGQEKVHKMKNWKRFQRNLKKLLKEVFE